MQSEESSCPHETVNGDSAPVAMASAVHCQVNPQVRPLVPTVMAPKLAYRRGKREGREEPVSKHQICSGDGRWAGDAGWEG